MPTYEYVCKSCGHSFEAFQSMSEAPLGACPQCGREVRRVINGGSGIIFKGSGFYVTDKKGGGSKAPGASKEPARAETPAAGGEKSSSTGPAAPAPAPAKTGGEGPSSGKVSGEKAAG